jgi:hypothetical protein
MRPDQLIGVPRMRTLSPDQTRSRGARRKACSRRAQRRMKMLARRYDVAQLVVR